MKIRVHHYHHFGCDEADKKIEQQLKELLNIAKEHTQILKEIKMTDQEVNDLLDQVNTTTNAIAVRQTADSTTLGTVKTELEALLATQGQPGGISDATAQKLQAMKTAVEGLKTNADTNSDVLTAIAAEGQPVVPQPPPPPANP